MDINPRDNEMCILEVIGQQIIDALKYGTHPVPNEYDSFPQVAGITSVLRTYVTSVIIDEFDNLISIDKNALCCVKNAELNNASNITVWGLTRFGVCRFHSKALIYLISKSFFCKIFHFCSFDYAE